MSSLAEIRLRIDSRRQELEEALTSVVRQLAAMGALRVVLFGSLASGTVDSESDLDLLIIMPSTRTGKQWTESISQNIKCPTKLDFLVLNAEEFDCAVPHNTFLRQICASGRVVYEGPGRESPVAYSRAG